MSLVSNKPVLSGSLKSVRLVSLKFSKKLIIASLVCIASQGLVIVTTGSGSQTYAQNPFISLATRNAWAGLVTRAKAAHDRKDHATAEKLLLEALDLVKNNDENLYINTLEILAAEADVTKHFDKDIEYRLTIVDYYAGAKEPPEQLASYKYKLGIAYHRKNQDEKALEYIEPAVKEMEPKFSPDSPFLADLYRGMAIALINAHRQKEAEPYITKANQINKIWIYNLQQFIKSVWKPPKLDHSVTAKVAFKVQLNGKLTNARIEQSSGNTEFDESCIYVVNGVTFPLKTWKYCRDGKPLDSSLTFGYNVDTTALPEQSAVER